MARSDLLISLVKAATSGDRRLLERTVDTVIAEERRKDHHILADRLESTMKENGQRAPMSVLADTARAPVDFVVERTPERSLESIVLPGEARRAIRSVIEENARRDLLRSYGLAPRHRILLAGPPGNGKTTLAECLAYELSVPLLTVRYDMIVGSFLGETTSRLRKLFEYVRSRECVLFFDEFDAIGKERGDVHETGEIKRVVSSLLLQIDELPNHVMAVTATNHPELLDRAVWRRFQLRLELPKPTRAQLTQWFEWFSTQFDIPLGLAPRTLADKLYGASYSEAEDFGLSLVRRQILSSGVSTRRRVAQNVVDEWHNQFVPVDDS